MLSTIFNSFIEIHFTYQNIHPLKVYSSVLFHIFTVVKLSQYNFGTFSAPQEDYYWLKSQTQWSSLITYRFSFRRDANDFCLVKKVAPKLMFLLSCRHLTSFVSNLAVLVQYSFSNAKAYTFNSPLNQLYHHADSLIDEVMKSVTCFHCIFVWESYFKVFETYIWQSECS